MQYKTITLELIQQHSRLHEQLRQERKLLSAVSATAKALRNRQKAVERHLSQTQPNLDIPQRAIASLEIAIQELASRLRLAFPPDATEPYPLNESMAQLRNLTPPE